MKYRKSYLGYAPSPPLYSNVEGMQLEPSMSVSPDSSIQQSAGQFTFGQTANTPISTVTTPINSTTTMMPANTSTASISVAPPPPIVTNTHAQIQAGSAGGSSSTTTPTNVTVINPIQTPSQPLNQYQSSSLKDMEQSNQSQSGAGGGSASSKKPLLSPCCIKCFIFGLVVGAAIIAIVKKKN